MSTIKEREKETAVSQLNLAVQDLIKSMNSTSKLNIALVNKEDESSWFEFSLEYPPYEDSPQKFQRRISNLEAEVIAWNIFHNIKDLLGYEYREDHNFIGPELTGFSSKLYFYKEVQFSIGFIEKR